MAAAPSSKKENAISSAIHHNAVGRASMGAHTSCVTCAIDLSPSIRGGRSTIAASAMMFFLALFFPLLGTITHDGQITHGRTDVKLFQHPVAPPIRHHLADLAVRVIEVAEVDRLRRAGLLACGLDRAVRDFFTPPLGLDLGFLDPLHAERALLHHAA